jgi:hypothetical protein
MRVICGALGYKLFPRGIALGANSIASPRRITPHERRNPGLSRVLLSKPARQQQATGKSAVQESNLLGRGFCNCGYPVFDESIRRVALCPNFSKNIFFYFLLMIHYEFASLSGGW